MKILNRPIWWSILLSKITLY
ncbi:hypothetical protein [Candidatus Karelsulcia muelleri]